MRSRSAGSISLPIAAASASPSRGGTTIPQSCSRTSAAAPERSVTIGGNPAAMASSTAVGRGS